MSNVFRGVYRFVPTIQRWQPGLKLAASLLNFHDTLLYLAFNYSTVRFENIPNSLFFDFRRMDPDSVKAGREQAAELKWIGFESGFRSTYTYWFLDSHGQMVRPHPDTKPKLCWRYSRESWQRHLQKISAGQEPAIPGKNLTIKPPHSENFRQLQSDYRKNPLSHSRETVANKLVLPKRLPLQSFYSEDVNNSEGVVFPSEKSSGPECTSPPWDAVGALEQGKKKAEGKGAKEADSKGSGAELLEHVVLDPVVQQLAKKLNAKMVDVVDLAESGARARMPGTPYEKWVQEKVFTR